MNYMAQLSVLYHVLKVWQESLSTVVWDTVAVVWHVSTRSLSDCSNGWPLSAQCPPEFLSELFVQPTSRPLRYSLRSASSNQLNVASVRLSAYGALAFSCSSAAVLHLWCRGVMLLMLKQLLECVCVYVVPTSPRDLHLSLTQLDPPIVAVTWTRPLQSHGPLDGYKLTYGVVSDSFIEERRFDQHKTTFSSGFLRQSIILRVANQFLASNVFCMTSWLQCICLSVSMCQFV